MYCRKKVIFIIIPSKKVLGEVVYAGGQQLGQAIELEIVKSVSQSYLTTLWNNENFEDTDLKFKNLCQYNQ